MSTGGNPKTADSLSFVANFVESFVGKRRRSRIESTKFATKLTTKLGEFGFLSAGNLFEQALIRRPRAATIEQSKFKIEKPK